MAIRIQTQDTFIPVEIGDLRLKFDTSDESLIRLRESMDNVQNVAKGIDELDDEVEGFKKAKEVAKIAFDECFGKGTFDKVYDISPSTTIVLTYFMQIAEGLQKEFNNRGLTNSAQEKAQQYLAKKK